MKRSGFKWKPRKPLKRTPLVARTTLERSQKPLRRTRLRVKGHSPTSETKEEIQALLRQIVILRDGGCVLRNYPETGECGGYRNDGELILQAEHLHSRTHSATFADTRNIICICRNHHIFFKPKDSQLYWEVVRKHIGEKLWTWLQAVRNDHRPHKPDWKLSKVVLEQELRHLSTD